MVTTESDRDLVAPAAEHEASHQDRLIGKDEGFPATRVLHCHLLPLQHTHIQHLKKKKETLDYILVFIAVPLCHICYHARKRFMADLLQRGL